MLSDYVPKMVDTLNHFSGRLHCIYLLKVLVIVLWRHVFLVDNSLYINDMISVYQNTIMVSDVNVSNRYLCSPRIVWNKTRSQFYYSCLYHQQLCVYCVSIFYKISCMLLPCELFILDHIYTSYSSGCLVCMKYYDPHLTNYKF